MKRLTVDDIMKMHPCYHYSREKVAELWAGRRSLSVSEILDLPIPATDRLWALLQDGVLPDRVLLLFAAACGERMIEAARQRGVQIDPRTAAVPGAMRDYADGRIGYVTLRRARIDALVAAAAHDHDNAAAYVAYAVRAAAAAHDPDDADTDAAAFAVSAASADDTDDAHEREAQIRDLRRLIEEEVQT